MSKNEISIDAIQYVVKSEPYYEAVGNEIELYAGRI